MIPATMLKANNMTYYLYIKSHCEAPDWEQEVEAGSKEEAIKMFVGMLGPDWDTSMIENDLMTDNDLEQINRGLHINETI